MPSKLDQLRAMTVVVADTGDLDAVRRLKPQDCTTNPTLLLKAVEIPAYGHLLEEALAWGRKQGGSREGVVAAICDRLAVAFGAELDGIVPGRVSTEVDADLSFDTEAMVKTARSIIEDYAERGVAPEKVLIKVAATWEGVEAARQLQAEGIDCNLTLIFNPTQAIACAEAGAFLISPFVGRILDWYKAHGQVPATIDDDPGVRFVRGVYAEFKRRGAATVVMGASFRSTGQVLALAGCDRLTISPDLLEQLDASTGTVERKLAPVPREERVIAPVNAAAFAADVAADAMASEKLAEGIAAFAKDLDALRADIAQRLA